MKSIKITISQDNKKIENQFHEIFEFLNKQINQILIDVKKKESRDLLFELSDKLKVDQN